MGLRNDELMVTRAEVLCRESEKPAVLRRDSVCCLEGPDSFEGCVSAEIRHGRSAVKNFSQRFLHFLTPAIFLGRCFTA